MKRLAVLGLLLAAGCAAAGCTAAGCTAAPPDDGRVAVVAGFYPLQYVAEAVGGDRVAVSNLAPPGAEPHDLELSPRQMADIADADLVAYVHGFQPAVDEAVELEASDAAFDAGAAVPRMNGDPHLWLDPTRLATVATALADRLAQIDPDGAPGYLDRASELGTRLKAVDRAYRDGLANCARREIVVSHDAFGYLADRYGLRQIPVTGLSPEAEPTPRHLAEAADTARASGATTIFFETLVSPKVAETLANAVGAQTAVLDPIEGLDDPAGDYVSVMSTNLDTLRTALGCR